MHNRYTVVFYCVDEARHYAEVWAVSRHEAIGAVLRAHPQARSAYVAACD